MNLTDCLAEEHGAIQRLMDLLEEEASQLASAEVEGDALCRLAEAKQAQLERLGTLAAKRRRLMGGDAALRPDEALSMARDAGCESAWRELLKMAEKVSRHNQGNGRMIQHRMAQNQRLLNMIAELRGRELYDQRGLAGRRGARVSLKA